MKVVINAAVIRSEGGVTLLQSLLGSFLNVMPAESRVVLFLNREITGRFENPDARIEIIPFRPKSWLARFFWEQFILPWDCLKQKADLLFSFANTGPLIPLCRQVLYVQQSIPYTRFVPGQNKIRWRLFASTYSFLMGLAQLGSQKIIVPTSWLIAPMRRSVLGLVSKKRYQTSLPGLPLLHDSGDLSDGERELLARVEICKHAGHKIIFYPAYLAPYKHIPYLLESIEQLRRKNISFRLLLTFDKNSPEYFPCKNEIFDSLARLGLTDEEVILCGELSRAAMARMYKLTDVLAFPSQVETLGLPMLEALSFGLPVVACETPFAREVCGEAALYAASADPAAFCAYLREIFENATTRQKLALHARERLSAFSWEAHARAILGV